MAQSGHALIIFDCDGVLVDSEYLFARVASECFAEIGIAISPAEAARRFAGVSVKDLLAEIALEHATQMPPGFEAYLGEREERAYAAELKPITGVRDAIGAIPHRRCVASSSLPARIAHSLAIAKLDDLFEPKALFSTTLVAHGKPAPDIFLHAARTMGERIEHCLVVEDSVPGVVGAIAARMRVVGFYGGGHCGPGHGENLRGAGAHLVIDTMSELPGAIRALLSRQ
jgi:HAD superfamily hydrolase (TIGR01509 family)